MGTTEGTLAERVERLEAALAEQERRVALLTSTLTLAAHGIIRAATPESPTERTPAEAHASIR